MKTIKWDTLVSVIGIAVSLVSANVVAKGGNAGGGNEDCPEGTKLVAKFETTNSGQYNVEGSANGVTISGANLNGGNWSSTTPIDYIIVKGGSQGAVTNDVGDATSGTFSNSNLPLNPSGKPPAISNIKFCAGGSTPIPPVVTCVVNGCDSMSPKTSILVDPKGTSDYKTLGEASPDLDGSPHINHPVKCTVTRGGQAVAGATVVITDPNGAEPTSATTGLDGTATFTLPISWDLDLVDTVKPYWPDGFTPAEVALIETDTHGKLPKVVSYTVTATVGSESASYNGTIGLSDGDVVVTYKLGQHSHVDGDHVEFSFYGSTCTITDGEGDVPAGLRVWQPIEGLTGVLPGDMFSPGVHYNVVKPDQAEYILEKIDEAGNSTFEPVARIK